MDSSDEEFSGAPPAQKQKKVYHKTVVPPREEPRSRRTPKPRIPFDQRFAKTSKRQERAARKQRIPVSERVIKVARSPPRQKSPKRKLAVKQGESKKKAGISSRYDDRSSSSSEEEDDEREVEDGDGADVVPDVEGLDEFLFRGGQESEAMQGDVDDAEQRQPEMDEERGVVVPPQQHEQQPIAPVPGIYLDDGAEDVDAAACQLNGNDVLVRPPNGNAVVDNNVAPGSAAHNENGGHESHRRREDTWSPQNQNGNSGSAVAGQLNGNDVLVRSPNGNAIVDNNVAPGNAASNENGGDESDRRREDTWSPLNQNGSSGSVDPTDSAPGTITTVPFRRVVFNAPFDIVRMNIIKIINSSNQRIAIHVDSSSPRIEFDTHYEILKPKEEIYVEIKTKRFEYQEGLDDRVLIKYINAPEVGEVGKDWFDMATITSLRQLRIEYSL